MKYSKQSLAGVVLIAAVLACNLQNTAPQETAPEIQTAAALTVQAILTPSHTATGVQTANAADSTTTPITTPTGALTVTITPTYSVPMLTVREQTNCRAGPGQSYEILFTYLKGKQLEIVGRYNPENYWLVKSSDSSTGTCWLWGEFVDVTGSYWVVASVTAPATATIAPPVAPSIQKWDFSCSLGTMTFIMSWTDKASNETGYRVFRNGELIVELPANSTSYTESIALLAGENAEYYLQVYAPNGSANSSLMKVSC